jgi:ssDNA-binding replication factor A large subunit
MSVSLIENKSPPTIRNNLTARASILRQIGVCNATKRPKITPRTRVEDLVSGRPIGRLELLVLRRYPRRTVMSKGWTGSIAAACGRDETGLIGLVLWGDQVDRVRTGDLISIQGGWCRYNNGQKVVSTGRTGRLTVLEA